MTDDIFLGSDENLKMTDDIFKISVVIFKMGSYFA